MTERQDAQAIAQAHSSIAHIDAEHPEPDDTAYLLNLCATIGLFQPAKPSHAMHDPVDIAKCRLLEGVGLLRKVASDVPDRLCFALTDIGRAAIG